MKVRSHRSLWVPKGKNITIPWKQLVPGIRSCQDPWESALSLLPLLILACIPYFFIHRVFVPLNSCKKKQKTKKSLHNRFWVLSHSYRKLVSNMKVELKFLVWIFEMEFFQALILSIFTDFPGLKPVRPHPCARAIQSLLLRAPSSPLTWAAPCRQAD